MLYKIRHEVEEKYELDSLNQGSVYIPDINTEELELALRKTKNIKSPSEDNVVSDALKIGDQRLL